MSEFKFSNDDFGRLMREFVYTFHLDPDEMIDVLSPRNKPEGYVERETKRVKISTVLNALRFAPVEIQVKFAMATGVAASAPDPLDTLYFAMGHLANEFVR